MRKVHSLRSTLAILSLLVLTGASERPKPVAPGSVGGQVEIKRGRRYKKDRSDVVLFLEGVPDSRPEPLKAPAVIDQIDKTFRPALTVVPVGSTVDFPNNDHVFHNVFSVSRPAKFDLGLYKSGSSKSVVFERPGVVDVYCNIHPDMAAKVFVVDTVHYVVTGPDGRFSLDGVPPGTYSLVAWQAQGDVFQAEVVVTAGHQTTVDIELDEQRWPKHRHTRKDGTPYGRYK